MYLIYTLKQTESDVLLLINGVLALTTLLPLIATYVEPWLHEFFEIYTRLAAFLNNRPGEKKTLFVFHLFLWAPCVTLSLYLGSHVFPCPRNTCRKIAHFWYSVWLAAYKRIDDAPREQKDYQLFPWASPSIPFCLVLKSARIWKVGYLCGVLM